MNLEQQSFITEYLRHRSAYTAYCKAYHVQDETRYDSIMSSANRLLDDPEVGGVIRSILDGIRHDVEQEIRAELKTDLLTVQRKREILAKIAAGEFYVVHNYKGKDCTMCSQHVWPTINQVLKAIDLDNKMAGLYSVDKPQFPVDNLTVTQQSVDSVQLTVDNSKEKIMVTQQIETNEDWQNTPYSPDGETQNLINSQQSITNNCPPLAGVSAGRGWTLAMGLKPQQMTNLVSPSEGLGATYNKTPSGVGETTTNHNNFKPAPLERGGRGLTLRHK